MKPPCVRRGWPDALLLHAHKGGQSNTGGEAHGIVVPPVLPRSHLSARNVRARAVTHRTGQQANEQQTVPLCARTPTPHLSVGTSELRAAHIGPSNTAPSCARPNSHAPTFRRGTSELQGDVHRGPKAEARTTEGWGDAIDGGDDRSRKLFASMAPEGPGDKNNNMVVVGAVGPRCIIKS